MRRFLLLISCCALSIAPYTALAQSVSSAVMSRQQELQNQLNDIESQIAVQQRLLDVAQGQHQTLQSQIDALNAEIKRTQLQIQAINLTITQLSCDLTDPYSTPAPLAAQRAAETASLA